MPSIPRYSGPQVDPRNAPSVRTGTYDTGQQALAQGAENLGKAVYSIGLQEREKADTAALMEYENQLAGVENDLFNNPQTGVYAKRGKDAFGVQDQVWPEWDKRTGMAMDALPERLRGRATQMTTGRRTDAQRGLMRHVLRETDTYSEQQEKGMQASAVNAATLNYLDPARIETEAARAMLAAEASAQRLGVDENTRGLLLADSASSVYQAVIERRMTDDPIAAREYYEANRSRLTGPAQAAIEAKLAPVMFEAQGESLADQIMAGVGEVQQANGQVHATFDAAMKVLGPTEGGYVNDPADRGGETNWGISKRAYPNLDIKSLTQAQARAIYKRDYWDAIGADSLPEEIRGLAFDAAVNHGVSRAKELLQESGGDPAQFAKLRHDLYSGIIKNDPSQRRFEAGWRARVDRLTVPQGAMGAMDTDVQTQSVRVAPPATEVEALQTAESIRNPLLRRQTETAIRRKFAMRDAAQREAEKRMDEQTNAALAQGDPSRPLRDTISPEAYARYEREGKIDTLEGIRMRRIQGTFVQDDPVLVEQISREAVTNPTAFMARNFDDPALQANLSTATLARFKTAASKPENQVDWATESQRIDGQLRRLGLGEDKNATGKNAAKTNEPLDRQRGEFRIAYRQAVTAFVQTYGAEPKPEQADVLARTVAAQFAERMKQGTTAAYSSGENYTLTISEADRAAVRQQYQAKYGRPPPDAWVTNYFAIKRGAAQ